MLTINYKLYQAWFSLSLHATDLHCCQKLLSKASMSHTIALSDTFRITMNMSTVVYFDSGLLTYTCCYCCKHFLDLEHQMFLNPQLKIVPNKCAFFKTPV